MTTSMVCPACGSSDISPFYVVSNVPVSSCMLLDDAAAARAFPCGDLRLAVCECGFITNAAFDANLLNYSQDYEETQGFSPRFRSYMTELASEWVARYKLAGKTAVEIGCGKGEFLAELLRRGVGHGVGIDPSVRLERVDPALNDRVTWISGMFPADYPVLDCDAVVCRHTLEHIAPVREFLRSIRQAIGARTETVVLFEVPDTQRILEEGAFWDVYYEHCSYFSVGSLGALFRRTGFEPLSVRRTYEDQYLVIEARPTAPEPAAVASDREIIRTAAHIFSDTQQKETQRWRDRVRRVAASGGSTVLWGASSKAVAFLSALGDQAGNVAAAVDINPYKQGYYLAGTGLRVGDPKELLDIRPDLVVAMNPVYLDEIDAGLASLGITTTLEAL